MYGNFFLQMWYNEGVCVYILGRAEW
jgi:hypothetical protein